MKLSLALSALLIFTACQAPSQKSTAKGAPVGKKGDNSEFALTGPQIQVLGKFANQGNEDAAIKLMNYYVFVDQNKKLALHWCEVGAKHGSKICQHNLQFLKSGKA